jgi:hypothetical protein
MTSIPNFMKICRLLQTGSGLKTLYHMSMFRKKKKKSKENMLQITYIVVFVQQRKGAYYDIVP